MCFRGVAASMGLCFDLGAVLEGHPDVVLVVCKDTAHAKWVEEYIKSDAFCNGAYRNKVVVVHSKQGAAESEANTKMLLEVEKTDNPVEIVIHKERAMPSVTVYGRHSPFSSFFVVCPMLLLI